MLWKMYWIYVTWSFRTCNVIWGCIPEVERGCVDMTNASSTYLSIAIGAVVGTLISWWIYKIQKNATNKQEETLRRNQFRRKS
jgi:hypothetical protein